MTYNQSYKSVKKATLRCMARSLNFSRNGFNFATASSHSMASGTTIVISNHNFQWRNLRWHAISSSCCARQIRCGHRYRNTLLLLIRCKTSREKSILERVEREPSAILKISTLPPNGAPHMMSISQPSSNNSPLLPSSLTPSFISSFVCLLTHPTLTGVGF